MRLVYPVRILAGIALVLASLAAMVGCSRARAEAGSWPTAAQLREGMPAGVVALDPSGRIMGQVRERGTTNSLVGASVAIYRGGALVTTATTDSDGIYLADTDLPTGTYVAGASKASFVTQSKTNITVTGGQTTYVNFNLDRVCLKGQVRIAGTTSNLVGATVAAYQGDLLKASAKTDANGIYEIDGLASGAYTVVASRTGYVRQVKPNISIVQGVVTYINFNLAISGKLKGQVRDRVTGAPLIGATVLARSGGVVRAMTATTAPYGVYEIASDLPAGTYSMNASKTGCLDQGKIGIVVGAGATTYVNFNLQPRFTSWSGVNLPWIHYGWDIGRNPWGGDHGGFSDNLAELGADFAFLAEHGVAVVRVFTFCDLRSGVLFDPQGNPTGFDSYAVADFDALLAAAESYHLKLIPVLFDYMVADGGPIDGEHPDLIADSVKRQALVDLFRTLVARYKTRSCILAWEVMNEPEYATAANPIDLKLFVQQFAAMIHSEAPYQKVTLGCANRGDLPAWTDAGLDLYQFHYYDDWESQYPFDFPAGSLGLDRPVLIGEAETTSIAAKLDAAQRNGYLGVLFWSLTAPYLGHGFGEVEADAYKAWVESH